MYDGGVQLVAPIYKMKFGKDVQLWKSSFRTLTYYVIPPSILIVVRKRVNVIYAHLFLLVGVLLALC